MLFSPTLDLLVDGDNVRYRALSCAEQANDEVEKRRIGASWQKCRGKLDAGWYPGYPEDLLRTQRGQPFLLKTQRGQIISKQKELKQSERMASLQEYMQEAASVERKMRPNINCQFLVQKVDEKCAGT